MFCNVVYTEFNGYSYHYGTVYHEHLCNPIIVLNWLVT